MSKILIVIDMQNDFVNGALGSKEAIEILPRAVKKIKSHKGHIIYTRDTHDLEYLNSREGKKLPIIHCVKGTDGWKLVNELDELAYEGSSKIFDKKTFGSIDMVNHVIDLCKNEEIEEIELIGVCTDICVISNAILLKAGIPEMKFTVDSKCCAGVTPESHINALKAMSMCHIEII